MYFFLKEAGVQSSSGQSFVTTPGGNEEVELTECEATMSEDVQPLDEHADENLLSQASQISVPGEEVSIWCDEKEIQNERRQALNDALGNLTSGRFSPIPPYFKCFMGRYFIYPAKVLYSQGEGSCCSYAVSHKSWARKRPLEMYPK